MYPETGYLYKNNKPLLSGLWEDLEYFVEELKSVNSNLIDRRKFKILSLDGFELKKWNRK